MARIVRLGLRPSLFAEYEIEKMPLIRDYIFLGSDIHVAPAIQN